MGCGASSQNTQTGNTRNAVPTLSHGNTGLSRRIVSLAQYSHGSPITHNDLNNLRNDFWGSRVGGNSIMWSALRTTSEALLNHDFVLANAILDVRNVMFLFKFYDLKKIIFQGK